MNIEDNKYRHKLHLGAIVSLCDNKERNDVTFLTATWVYFAIKLA